MPGSPFIPFPHIQFPLPFPFAGFALSREHFRKSRTEP